MTNTFDADAEFYANAAMIRGKEALEADGRTASITKSLAEANARAEQYRLAAERLQLEVTTLLAKVDGQQTEIARLRAQADVDAAHIAGLMAEEKALIQEIDLCPEKDVRHPLALAKGFVNGVTGKHEIGRVVRDIYRQAFDNEASARGLDDIEHLRR